MCFNCNLARGFYGLCPHNAELGGQSPLVTPEPVTAVGTFGDVLAVGSNCPWRPSTLTGARSLECSRVAGFAREKRQLLD